MSSQLGVDRLWAYSEKPAGIWKMMQNPLSFLQPMELFTYMVGTLQVWTTIISKTSSNMAENRIYRRVLLKNSTELMFAHWNTLELLARYWQKPPGSRKT